MTGNRMDRAFVFFVPGPVRGQGRPKAVSVNGHARVYQRAEDVSYKALIQSYAMQKMEKLGIHAPADSLDDGFIVSIRVRKAIPKHFSKKKRQAAEMGLVSPFSKPDLDNVAKIFLDALNGIVYRDDRYVKGLYVTRVYTDGMEGAEVAIAWSEEGGEG